MRHQLRTDRVTFASLACSLTGALLLKKSIRIANCIGCIGQSLLSLFFLSHGMFAYAYFCITLPSTRRRIEVLLPHLSLFIFIFIPNPLFPSRQKTSRSRFENRRDMVALTPLE